MEKAETAEEEKKLEEKKAEKLEKVEKEKKAEKLEKEKKEKEVELEEAVDGVAEEAVGEEEMSCRTSGPLPGHGTCPRGRAGRVGESHSLTKPWAPTCA